ncbi:MAG: DUF4270 domain-containing protein, partial [Muribaculaceae bacterium]|nr:DUF4270 domain-containing protein [Muribaculaceae bacterium]
MRFIIPALAISMAAAVAVTGCEEASTMGSSLIQDETEFVIDSSFTATGRSVENKKVQSRTIVQLLGKIDAKGYGMLQSDVVTQFMPANVMVTEGVTSIDSIKLRLAIPAGGFVGDSLVPMGLEVYRLNRQLPSPIYSDFDPSGYYDPANTLGGRIYSAAAIGESDSLAELSYRFVYVDLDKSLGEAFYNEYKTNPEVFSSPSQFAQYFPGMYIANTYGSGRVMQIISSEIKMFYSQTLPKDDGSGADTTYARVGTYFAVTPEIVTNNNIDFSPAADVENLAQSNAVIMAPAGYDVELMFPAEDIIDKFRSQTDRFAVVNTLEMEIPASEITNDYGIDPPEYLLMVLAKDKDRFFNENKVTDGKTSFYAAYDSSTHSYKFSGMRQYIID